MCKTSLVRKLKPYGWTSLQRREKEIELTRTDHSTYMGSTATKRSDRIFFTVKSGVKTTAAKAPMRSLQVASASSTGLRRENAREIERGNTLEFKKTDDDRTYCMLRSWLSCEATASGWVAWSSSDLKSCIRLLVGAAPSQRRTCS